jgi:hypothetical protein
MTSASLALPSAPKNNNNNKKEQYSQNLIIL